MTQLTGDLSFNMAPTSFSAFVQDDWQIAPSVKLLYGVRYDLYQVSGGARRRAAAQTHSFNIDRNNFGPRVGVAWSMDTETVVRAQHRHHVRPADSRRLRAGAADVRVAARAGLHLQRHVGRRAGVPERRRRPARSRSSRRGRSIRPSWSRTPGRATRRSNARSAATSRRRSA